MRTLIVDDERLARAELRRLLAEHPEVQVVGEAANIDEAAREIEALRPDLLLLDIKMPGGSGFDLLERLESAPQVIFTTAFDEFALQAFEVNALDYLLKPVSAERLSAALQRVREKRAQVNEPLSADQRIFLREGERCWFVPMKDVVLLESEGNYTRVFFGPDRCLIPRSLNALEEKLDGSLFFRASRRHIVNLRAITAVDPSVGGGLEVQLKGGLKVEMSRRRSLEFRERMSF